MDEGILGTDFRFAQDYGERREGEGQNVEMFLGKPFRIFNGH